MLGSNYMSSFAKLSSIIQSILHCSDFFAEVQAWFLVGFYVSCGVWGLMHTDWEVLFIIPNADLAVLFIVSGPIDPPLRLVCPGNPSNFDFIVLLKTDFFGDLMMLLGRNSLKSTLSAYFSFAIFASSFEYFGSPCILSNRLSLPICSLKGTMSWSCLWVELNPFCTLSIS